MNRIIERKRYWIGGSLTAVAGIICVRLVSPGLTGNIAKLVLISGYTLSFVGILIIACAARRKGFDDLVQGIKEVSFMEVRAPIEGKILKVCVKVGDKVDVEDDLFVLEACKMENHICAEESGTVKEINVKADEMVDSDHLLLVLG